MTSRTENVLDGIETLLKSLEKLARDGAMETGQDRDDVREALQSGLSQAANRLNQLRDELAEQMRTGAKSVNDFVEERPWTAVGIAAAAAFIFGLALARRD